MLCAGLISSKHDAVDAGAFNISVEVSFQLVMNARENSVAASPHHIYGDMAAWNALRF